MADEIIGRFTNDGLRIGKLGNTTIVNNENAVRKRECFFRVVRDDQRCQLELTGDTADAFLDAFFNNTVQSRERLEKKKNAGLHHQRAGNGHALFLTAGEFADALRKVFSQT